MDLVAHKPHVVCLPCPAQSHIKAMLKLAKLLCNRGFRVTFVNTEYNHKRILKSGGPDFLVSRPDFEFESIPDGIQASDTDITQDLDALCVAMRDTMLSPLIELLQRISPVSCIVSDAFVLCTTYAGERLGISVVLSWSVAASHVLEVCELRKTDVPVKDESSCMKDSSGDTDSYLNDIKLNYYIDCAINGSKSSANIIQTFEDLEIDSLSRISSMLSDIYTVGPLELLLAKLPKQEHLDSIGYSLWKEEPQCLKWLDSRKENSVLYVNLGSIATMSPEKMLQFARGLANSEKDFLWIIRPDMLVGEGTVLLNEVLEETKDRGFTVSWCPQEDVLKHPSVFGFLTHCGWNSIIESLSAGTPMICLPFFGDQPINCEYICNEWDVGLQMDGNLKSDDVERVVREFMEGDKGKKMKKKAFEWKEKAEKATGEDGSSFINFDKIVGKIFQF